MISRRLAFRVHKGCGLVIAPFVLVQALTGCLLVYHERAGQLLDPAGMVRRSTSGAASLQTIVRSLRQAQPGYEPRRIVFPTTARGTYFVHLADARGALTYASVDPGDGGVLRRGALWSFPTVWALQIHETLLSGTPGVFVVILLGVTTALMVATGLIHGWPRSGGWRKGLAVDLALPPRLVLRRAHRTLAVFVFGVVGVSATTGVVLAVALLVDRAPKFPDPGGGPAARVEVGIDQGLAAARRLHPARGVRDVRLPRPDRLNVYFRAPERGPAAVHLVGVDLTTGRIVGQISARDDPGLWVVPLPIHTGESLGWVGRLLVLVGGFGLALLAASGVVMGGRAPKTARMSKAKPEGS